MDDTYMRVSINGGAPRNGWLIVEPPIKTNDLGVPRFQETSIYEPCTWGFNGDLIAFQV